MGWPPPVAVARPINQLDVTFMPEGHPGRDAARYDIHMYFVSPEETATICPGGHTARAGGRAGHTGRRS